MNPILLVRATAAGCLAGSGVIHAQLYLTGYRTIPWIGPAFLLQASGSFAVALLLLLSSAAVLRLAAAALAAGALVGFIASRTIGVLGFVEYGLLPAPQALISVLVEISALALLAVPFLDRTAARPALSLSR
ncbi:MAG TPA: hypothetical protein VGL46_18260 [Pseudonocardiaceae bacterium]|jgi:hypothetical protein